MESSTEHIDATGTSGGNTRSRSILENRYGKAIVSALLLFVAATVVTYPFTFLGSAMERIIMLVIINMIAVVGINIFTGNSGILSIGHLAFFAFGAYTTGLMTTDPELKAAFLPELPDILMQAQLGLPMSLLVVVGVSLVLGVITGLPVSRLRDTSAIIATFGFLVICHFFLIGAKDLTNGNKAFYGVPASVGLFTVFLVLGATLLLAFVFKESKYGLQVRAFRESELAASAMGVPCNLRLLQSWIVSAIVMGIAGALFAHTIGAFSPRNLYLTETFALVAMLVIGGLRSITGAVLGTLLISLLVELIRPIESGFEIFGAEVPALWGITQITISAVILLVMYLRPAGVMGSYEISAPRALTGLLGKTAGTTSAPGSDKARSSPERPDQSAALIHLTTQKLGIRFGGLQALSDVSVDIPMGKIVGLIGPNGAGKTTLINNMTGVLQPTAGTVHIGTSDVTGWSMHAIALTGLARTFQSIRLFKDLSVLENVMVSASAAGTASAQLEAEALFWLENFNLQGDADRKAGTLPYGAQRKLEIARALALQPKFLMLDEPAAGMNQNESEELLNIMRLIRNRFGVGVLVVDHDLHLIMRLCDEVIVLNKGEVIAAGSPEAIQKNPDVIEAYLGTENQPTN